MTARTGVCFEHIWAVHTWHHVRLLFVRPSGVEISATSTDMYRLSQICHLLGVEIKICCPEKRLPPSSPTRILQDESLLPQFGLQSQQLRTHRNCLVCLGVPWIAVVTNWLELVRQLGPVQTHLQIARTDGWKYRGQRERERDMNQLWAYEKEALQCGGMSKQNQVLARPLLPQRGLDPLHLGDCCQSLLC